MTGLKVRSSLGGKYGTMMKKGTPAPVYIKGMLFGREYHLGDIFRWMKGMTFSIQHIWPGVMKQALEQEIKCLKVPVLFCLGRHDHQAPASIAQAYIGKLKAEVKEVVWFEESAHMCLMEEKRKFDDVVIDFVKRITEKGRQEICRK